jgi:hypothetical protein
VLKKLLLSLLLLLPSVAFTQDVSQRYQAQVIGSRGLPLANQNVAVCTQPAVTTTQPCSPLAILGTSTTTSSGGPNPLTTDANGNFFFYATPGKYTIQIYGPQVGTPFIQPDTVIGVSGVGGTVTTLTVTGALNANGNGAAGNVAVKYATGDAVRYVSATGNDANDGLSMGTAKATLSGVISTLPNCTPIQGAYNTGGGINQLAPSFTAPCGTIYLAANPNGYSLTSTLTLNGKLIKIVGIGELPVGINCTTTTTCINVNNVAPFTAGPDELWPTDGGVYNIVLNGQQGLTNQIGLSVTEANNYNLDHVRFTNFNGTGAGCAKFITVTSGNPMEELNLNYVEYDNCTNGLWLHGGTQNSFGHNIFHHQHWLLNNGQCGLTLDGTAGVYSSVFDGVFNAVDTQVGDSATAICMSGTASFRSSQFNVPIDNGSGLAIALCSGCTASNLQITGMLGANPPQQISRDNGPIFNVTAANYLTSPLWQFNGANKWSWALDGSNNFTAVDAANIKATFALVPNGGMYLVEASCPGSSAGNDFLCADSVLHQLKQAANGLVYFPLGTTGNTNGTHSDSGFYQTATSAGCTTAASIGGVCATPITLTWPVAFQDTNYKVQCTPNGAATNIPGTPYTVTKAAGTLTVNYFAITAAAASWPNIECNAVHN